MRSKPLIFLCAAVLIVFACNMPEGQTNPAEGQSFTQPSGSNEDVVGTTVALTTSARMTELAATAIIPAIDTPTFTPTVNPPAAPTQCTPSVMATVASNIRSGPGTVYEIIGFLPQNGSTTLAGKNDANTWWYILLPGKTSDYGWISGSVVTSSCLPASVQVVAAPPTPVQPTEEEEANNGGNAQSGTPDLVAVGFQYWPEPGRDGSPIDIMVRLKNNGNGAAGNFSVAWLSNQDQPGCNWSVDSLGAGVVKDLECQFTYHGNPSADYWVTLVVDTGNSVSESDEGNNSRDFTLKVRP